MDKLELQQLLMSFGITKELMQSNKNSKKYIIYCRESRDDYGINYERIETQRDLCLRYCKDKEYYNIIDIIIQDDTTGTDFRRFNELKQKIINHEFDTLIMKDDSRLGRNQKEALIFLDLLKENNIELEFVTVEFDEDFFGIRAWFNEMRAKDDSKKIRSNLRHKMEEGTLLIRGYFGYKKIGQQLIVDEEAAKIVKKIFNLYLKGYGYRTIANQLNELKIPTPSQYKAHGRYPVAKTWKSLHVQRILTNRVYIGDKISGTTEKISFKSNKIRKIPEEEWIIHENHHEAIVDREIFYKVQKLIKSKRKYAPKTPTPSPFSGKLICGKCRSPMFIIRSKRIPHAFLCGKYYNEGAVKNNLNIGCTSHRVREEELFKIVREHLKKLFQDESYKKELEESSLKYNSSQEYIQELISKTEQEIQLLQNQYKQVYNDKLNNIIPEFLFIDKTKELQEKIEKLNTKSQKLLDELSKIEKGVEDYKKFEIISNKILKSGLTKETVEEIIDTIIVFDEHEIQEDDKTIFNISDDKYTRTYENGGIIIIYKGMYQHVLTNRWIRTHIGTWRERVGGRIKK